MNIIKDCRNTYLSPRLRKCWPIRRTISMSFLDIFFLELFAVGTEEVPLHEPFDTCVSSPSWLFSQPFACIIVVASLFFLRGGLALPLSSLSDVEASLLKLSDWSKLVHGQLLYFRKILMKINNNVESLLYFASWRHELSEPRFQLSKNWWLVILNNDRQ